jgi:tetratricopeptide (TPR) repeat protein
MARKTVGLFPRALARAGYFPIIFLLLFRWAGSSPRETVGPMFQAARGAPLSQEMQKAKAELQAGVNTWSLELFQSARDRFINCLMKAERENAYILYHIALADYRLVTFYLSSKANEDAGKSLQEAQKYLDKAMAVDPSFGESLALYGFLLGFEIGLHPEKAMTLGMASFDYSARAVEKDPENPRIHLLKGISLFYTPEAYGGGVDNAVDALKRAATLFEKETVNDPFKPSWGKEEAYTYLGISYKRKKDIEKAKEMLQKALEINPEFGLAKRELTGLEKNSPF